MTKPTNNRWFRGTVVGALATLFVAVLMLGLRPPAPAQAATSSTLNFQARLLQASGAVVPDGYYHAEFKIYNDATPPGTVAQQDQGACTHSGGTADSECKWVETYTGASTAARVRVVNGYLTVNLGTNTPFGTNINWDQDLWLTMRIGGSATSASWDSEMSPRLKLTAVPYAFRAGQLAKQTGANTSTLDFAVQSAANTILLPDASGTLAIATSGGFTANGVLYGNGTAAIQATSAGTAGQCLIATAGAPTWGSCTGGSTISLQGAYDGGATINTASAKDILFNLADTATDSKFIVDLQGTGNTFEVQDGGTTFFAVSDNRNITYTPTANGQLSVTNSSLTGGRSSALVAITQANDAGVGAVNTGGLLSLTNSDADSTAAVLAVTQSATDGTGIVATSTGNSGIAFRSNSTGGFGFSAPALTNGFGFSTGSNMTSGIGFNLSTSSTGLTSGIGFNASGTASGTLSSFTGSMVNVNPVRTHTGATTITDSGTFLNLNRANTINNAGGVFNVTGAVANIQSNCTVTAGTCNDSANLLALNQQYAGATGAVINVQGAGTGNLATLDASNASANGVSIDVQSSNIAQYALNITTNNGATKALSVRGNGQVGINTTAPSEKLTVNGNFNVRDADTATKQYRFRTSGGALDLEGAGADMIVSVWSGADLTGTQYNKLVLKSGSDSSEAIRLWEFKDSAYASPHHTINGSTGGNVVFNDNSEATNFTVEGDTDAFLLFGQGSTDRIGIGTNTPGYKLDVVGDVNTSTQYRIGGTVICTSSGCTPAAGSNNYVQLQGATPGSQQTGHLNISGTGIFGTSLATSSTGSFDLINTNATTVNAFGAATALNLGAAAGTTITPGGNLTFAEAQNKTLTVSGSLSGGARSTDLVVISQANDTNNNSTANLLEVNNADTASNVAAVNIVQSATGGASNALAASTSSTSAAAITAAAPAAGVVYDATGVTTGIGYRNTTVTTGSAFSVGSTSANTTLTTGAGLLFNATSTAMTTGSALRVTGSASSATLSGYTGSLISVAPTRTYSGAGTVTDSGSFLNLTRANTNSGAGTFAITGALASLQSNCTASSGTCSDSGNILRLNQQYANATGDVLSLTDNGQGASVLVNKTGSAGNILQVQKNSVNALVVGNAGTVGVGNNSTPNAATALGIDHIFGAGTDCSFGCYGTISNATVNAAAASGVGPGVGSAVGVYSRVKTSTTSGTLGAGIGLLIDSALAGAGSTLEVNYGISVNAQTAGSLADYGVAIGAADTQTLWLSNNANNTTANAGIAFGSSRDTNLYRSAGDTLRTDDSFSVGTLGAAAGTSTYLCRDTATGLLTSCNTTGNGVAFVQGGNSFTAQAVLGTNDNNSLAFETNDITRAVLDTTGNLTFQQASGITTTTGNLTVDAAATLQLGTSTATGVSLGRAAGTFQLASTGLNVSTGGALTGVSGITTSGGYTQSGTSTNTFTGVTSVGNNATPSANTALTVNHSFGAGSSCSAVAGCIALQATSTITSAVASPSVAVGLKAGVVNTSANPLNTAIALYAASPVNTSPITNAYGLMVDPVTVGTSGNYGISVKTAGTQTLWLSSDADNVGANAGIAFGQSRDTKLYRSGANTLRTDGTFALGASAGTGSLLNNGSTVNTVLTTGNFTGSGAIGTAAATVDIYTYIAIPQTTGSLTLSLPTPTASTTYGRIVYITNTGTAAFTLSGVTLNPGASATMIWSNTNGTPSWTFAGADGSSILNQNTVNQSANFRISGTGQANGGFLAPSLDVASAGALSLGTGTATSIALGSGSVTTISLTGTAINANTANLTFNQTSTISNSQIGSNAAGYNMTVRAGQGGTGNNSGGSLTLSGGANSGSGVAGSVIIKSPTGSNDTTTALLVQNAAGGNLFQVDAVNSSITLNGNNAAENQPWTTTTSLSAVNARDSAAATYSNGYVYVTGGTDGSTFYNTAIYSKVNADGTLGSWSTSANTLPAARVYHDTVAANGYIYVLGGSTNGSNTQSTVYYAKLNADGSTGAFSTTTALPVARKGGSAVVANGYIYYVGGDTGSAADQTNVSGTREIDYAKLNADGTIGAWTQVTTALPSGEGRAWSYVTVANGNLYVIGGFRSGTTFLGSTYFFSLNATNGSLGTVNTASPNLPNTNALGAVYTQNGYIYVVNGFGNFTYIGTVSSTGSVTWTTGATANKAPARQTPSWAQANGYFYFISGYSGSAQTSVYYTSTPRTRIAGSLDLVGFGGQRLADAGGIGGNLTAGNTIIAGTLQTYDAASFLNTVSVEKDLHVGSNFYVNTATGTVIARATTDSSGTFQVQNAAGATQLSVDTSSLNLAINGGAEAGSPPTGWVAHGAATIASTTTPGEVASGLAGVRVTTNGSTQGVRNNVGTALSASTTYNVSFSVKASAAILGSNFTVIFSPTGTTSNNATCAPTAFNPVVSNLVYTKYTCILTTTSTTTTSSAYLTIHQLDSFARSIYIDNLSIVQQNSTGTQNTGTLRVGGANSQGLTLLTLDTYAGTPFTGVNQLLAGSMYFDTTTSKIQCYDGIQWGACGAAPNSIITVTPEYPGAVLHSSGAGTDVGTMSSDFCANSAALTAGTLCGSNDARNFYRWTSPQASMQEYDIYVTYKLPSTFKNFLDDNTITLTARSDGITGSNGTVTYEVYKSTGSSVTACGTETTVTTTDNTWQTVPINGNENSSCGFAANNNVIFKIRVKAKSNANVYVENINFTYTNQ